MQIQNILRQRKQTLETLCRQWPQEEFSFLLDSLLSADWFPFGDEEPRNQVDWRMGSTTGRMFQFLWNILVRPPDDPWKSRRNKHLSWVRQKYLGKAIFLPGRTHNRSRSPRWTASRLVEQCGWGKSAKWIRNFGKRIGSWGWACFLFFNFLKRRVREFVLRAFDFGQLRLRAFEMSFFVFFFKRYFPRKGKGKERSVFVSNCRDGALTTNQELVRTRGIRLFN